MPPETPRSSRRSSILNYDGHILKLYVDGRLVGTDSYSGRVGSVSYELGIGLNNDPEKAGVSLRGQMDAVHVYSSILTDAQVADLAAGTSQIRPTDDNVVLWYDADSYESVKAGHTHTPADAVRENEKPVTCTEDGSWESVIYCAECGEEVSRKVITTPLLGHDFVNGDCTCCDEVKASRFQDVKAGDFFFDPVEWAVDEGITTGISEELFDPDGKCMRAVVVTFLWRAAGEPEPASTVNPFVDVAETDFYYKAVLWAVEKGITNGISATEFGVGGVCNRAQVVTFLFRTMDAIPPVYALTEYANVIDQVSNGFSDCGVWLKYWFHSAVEALHNYGYHKEAEAAAFKLFDNAKGLLADGTIRENYNPETGGGLNAGNFSWSSAAFYNLFINPLSGKRVNTCQKIQPIPQDDPEILERIQSAHVAVIRNYIRTAIITSPDDYLSNR